jgi:hypothetical protein
MILEESSASFITRPISGPRGLGGQEVVQAASTPYASASIHLTTALNRIPASLWPLEEWTALLGGPNVAGAKVMRPRYFAGIPATNEIKARLFALNGLNPDYSNWVGLTVGRGATLLNAANSDIWVHEYGHFVDSQLGRIQDQYKATWNATNATAVTSRPAWASAWREANALIKSNGDANAYGATNVNEWFAELFAAQLISSYVGIGAVSYSTVFFVLCGRDVDLTGHIRGLFQQIIPDLPKYGWRDSAGSTRLTPCVSGRRLSDLRTGVPFTRTFVSEVSEAVIWAVTAGSLPAGLAMSNGNISGSPTTPGAFDFTLTASNANGSTSRRFTGTVFDSTINPPVITTPEILPAALSGEPWSATLAATGAGPITWTRVVGPATVAVAQDGTITVPDSSTFTGGQFTARATNAGGVVEKTFTIPYGIAAKWFTTTVPDLTAGQTPSSAPKLGAQGSFPIYISLTGGAVPAGMTLDAPQPSYDAYLRGTPTTPGPYSFELTVTNEFGTAARTFSGTVLSP